MENALMAVLPSRCRERGDGIARRLIWHSTRYRGLLHHPPIQKRMNTPHGNRVMRRARPPGNWIQNTFGKSGERSRFSQASRTPETAGLNGITPARMEFRSRNS